MNENFIECDSDPFDIYELTLDAGKHYWKFKWINIQLDLDNYKLYSAINGHNYGHIYETYHEFMMN